VSIKPRKEKKECWKELGSGRVSIYRTGGIEGSALPSEKKNVDFTTEGIVLTPVKAKSMAQGTESVYDLAPKKKEEKNAPGQCHQSE